jgi:hypothetical protein
MIDRCPTVDFNGLVRHKDANGRGPDTSYVDGYA